MRVYLTSQAAEPSPLLTLSNEDLTFDYERLATAISMQDRSYRFLLWVRDAINEGQIQPSRVVHHSGGPEAATQWLRSIYYHIPPLIRPPEESLEEFAAFFSTYLTSSFEVVDEPGTKGLGPISKIGCRCDLCLRIINAPFLQTKKLFKRDKDRANFLMVECLEQLAAEKEFQLDEKLVTQIVTDPRTRRAAAYLAYGHWLIKRLEGESDGPAILALWRLIAWKPSGGIRRGFTLELNDFKEAEKLLISTIQDAN